MRKLRRKKLIALFMALAAAGVAGGAYAYWTTSGTGTGTASNGTSSAVTIVGTAATALYPGSTSTVTFTASNPGTTDVSISNIHLVSVQAYPTATDRTNGTLLIASCGGANVAGKDFTMPDVAVPPATDGDILHGAVNQALTTTGTLTMADLVTIQDSCKGAFLALTFTTA